MDYHGEQCICENCELIRTQLEQTKLQNKLLKKLLDEKEISEELKKQKRDREDYEKAIRN